MTTRLTAFIAGPRLGALPAGRSRPRRGGQQRSPSRIAARPGVEPQLRFAHARWGLARRRRRARQRSCRVSDEEIRTVLRVQPLDGEAGRDHGTPHPPRFENLQARAAAGTQRHDHESRFIEEGTCVDNVPHHAHARLPRERGNRRRRRRAADREDEVWNLTSDDRQDLGAEPLDGLHVRPVVHLPYEDGSWRAFTLSAAGRDEAFQVDAVRYNRGIQPRKLAEQHTSIDFRDRDDAIHPEAYVQFLRSPQPLLPPRVHTIRRAFEPACVLRERLVESKLDVVCVENPYGRTSPRPPGRVLRCVDELTLHDVVVVHRKVVR